MKYLFLIHGDESGWNEMSPEEQAEGMKAWDAFTKEAIDAGVHLGGEALAPAADTTTLRAQGTSERLVTDGPFAETKEVLTGYYLLECKDHDEAISWGKKIPVSEALTIDVRAVMDYEASGSEVHSSSSEVPAS
jgi:hypothetical protein